MRIDDDILRAVEKFNSDSSNQVQYPDMPSRVNKIFRKVTGILDYIWNVLTLGRHFSSSYFSERTAMIRSALRGENNESFSTNALVNMAMEGMRAQGQNPSAAEVYALLGFAI